jgi:hypothetical protein
MRRAAMETPPGSSARRVGGFPDGAGAAAPPEWDDREGVFDAVCAPAHQASTPETTTLRLSCRGSPGEEVMRPTALDTVVTQYEFWECLKVLTEWLRGNIACLKEASYTRIVTRHPRFRAVARGRTRGTRPRPTAPPRSPHDSSHRGDSADDPNSQIRGHTASRSSARHTPWIFWASAVRAQGADPCVFSAIHR